MKTLNIKEHVKWWFILGFGNKLSRVFETCPLFKVINLCYLRNHFVFHFISFQQAIPDDPDVLKPRHLFKSIFKCLSFFCVVSINNCIYFL